MPLMTLPKTRVFDPVLRDLSIGYTNSEAIWNMIMPAVPVTLYGGKLIVFDKATRSKRNFSRSPESGYRTIRRTYSDLSYALELKGGEFPVPIEHATDAEENIGLQWDQIATDTLMEGLTLELEDEVATLVTTAATYPTANKTTLSGSSQWSDSTSDIFDDVKAAKSAVRKATGRDPNVMWMGSDVWDAVCDHPAVVDRFKHTQVGILNEELVAGAFGVEKLAIGKMTDSSSGSDEYIWGKFAGLAYVDPRALQTGRLPLALNGQVNRFRPSFGYTYVMENHPFPKPVEWDEGKDTWFYRTKFDREPNITSIDSGFLFSAAVA